MGKRMYLILKIIQDEKKTAISALDITEKLKEYDIFVDVKTVYADIRRINDFFRPWLEDEMIQMMKRHGASIHGEIFTDGELQFLIDSISFHEDLNEKDKEQLKTKLFQLSSYHQKNRLVHFTPKQKDIPFSLFTNLTTIMKAIENKQLLSFQYITYDILDNHLKEVPSMNGNEQDKYMISPYQIVSSNNHYYLIGYNKKHKRELTTYRIDRMRMLTRMKKGFVEMREQYDMSDEISKTTNMYISNQRETIQIECGKKLLREITSHFIDDVIAQKLYDDYYLITVKDVPLSEGLIGWIMMLQDQLKIVSPQSLQLEITKRIKKMSQLYAEDKTKSLKV